MDAELPSRDPRGLALPDLAGVYRTTLDGVFVDCNDAMARILGFQTREDLLAASEPLRFDGRHASLAHLRQSGTVTGQEAYLHRRGAHPARVVYSERLVTDAGGRELVEGTLIDVTGRPSATGDRLLSTLAGGVAHGVSEPLATVAANLGFAIETLAALGPRGGLGEHEMAHELDRALQDARRGADAIRQVLRGLVVFARPPGAGGGSADLRKILESTLSVVAAELKGRARLEVDIGETPPVAGGEPLLGRCLLQILLEAIDAMGDGRPGHRLRVSARREERLAIVEIEDSGHRPPDGDHGVGLLGAQVVVAALHGSLAIWPGSAGGRLVRLELPIA
jgi:hypothetical protein